MYLDNQKGVKGQRDIRNICTDNYSRSLFRKKSFNKLLATGVPRCKMLSRFKVRLKSSTTAMDGSPSSYGKLKNSIRKLDKTKIGQSRGQYIRGQDLRVI